MAEAVEVLEDLREAVLVPDEVGLFEVIPEAVPVFVGPMDRLTVVVAVPVLVWETDLVGLAEAVEVLVDVTEPVVVPVTLRDPEPLDVLVKDGDEELVLDDPVERDSVGDAEVVLDNPGVRDCVGLDELVLDDVVVAVPVEVVRDVIVPFGDADCVLDPAGVMVPIDDAEPDLEAVEVFVDVIELVVVLVVVVEGLGSIVKRELLVVVVVFVDVLDWVDVEVVKILRARGL